MVFIIFIALCALCYLIFEILEKELDIIQLLPDHVANQIAAGEVIQRPASAAKEMLENAIDSGGADNIQLIIKDAGKTLIQVVDNGCGMSEKDCTHVSFERHATSKINRCPTTSVRYQNNGLQRRSYGFYGSCRTYRTENNASFGERRYSHHH